MLLVIPHHPPTKGRGREATMLHPLPEPVQAQKPLILRHF